MRETPEGAVPTAARAGWAYQRQMPVASSLVRPNLPTSTTGLATDQSADDLDDR